MDEVGWLAWFAASDYGFAREVLQRGTALLYVVGFVAALVQFPALLGEHGLLPVPEFLRREYGRRQPTLFRWHYSDRLLRVVAVGGAALAAVTVAGLPQAGPAWVPVVVFLVLWLLYLSIVNVGQTFYGFGWETLLCEAGFTVGFLGSQQVAVPFTVIVLLRWLVFRVEFGAGMIKLRGGREWRDLTALDYHHETQPMPNPVSRWAHLLPKPWHRIEVLGNHVAQLVVPWLLFLPQPVASIAAAAIILTQFWLVITGNFAWLNAITIVLAFCGIGDGVVHALVPAWPATAAAPGMPWWFGIPVLAVSAFLVVLSRHPLRNLVARRQLMNASFNRWHLANAYGAFGTVTKQRDEVIVEGSAAPDPHDEDAWRPYEFRGKPGDVRRIPPQVAPYHLRLDWLMWFLALGSPDSRWFEVFLRRLLEADRATLRLLRHDPFGGVAPQWVRARVFRYRFAPRAERRGQRVIWIREERGMLVRPVSLDILRDPAGRGRTP
jgi:hypothetical protein